MFCGHCGKELPDAAKFCGYCGAPVIQCGADMKGEVPIDNGRGRVGDDARVDDGVLYRSSGVSSKFKFGCVLSVVSCAFAAAMLLLLSFATVERYVSVDMGGGHSFTSGGTDYVTAPYGMGTAHVPAFDNSIIVVLRLGALGFLVYGVVTAIAMYARGKMCSVLVKGGSNPGMEVIPLVSTFSPKPAPIATFISIGDISQIGSILKIGEFRLTLKSGEKIRVLAQDPEKCLGAVQSLFRAHGGFA